MTASVMPLVVGLNGTASDTRAPSVRKTRKQGKEAAKAAPPASKRLPGQCGSEGQCCEGLARMG